MQFTVGLKLKGKADRIVVDAESPLLRCRLSGRKR
jgi:hypothetical protein